MANLNLVQLIGNLTKDPELKFTESGAAVAKMSVAINNKYKGKDGEMKTDVEYVNLVVWGKTAENCSKYLAKGRPVYVSGRMQTRSWEKDGIKRYATEVVVNEVQFLGSSPGAHGDKPSSSQGESASAEDDNYGPDGNIPF
ncbi:MAG: single-stranded DNA-binding protein [Candidatus Riflebacteria bacterium]|nr:single-stranded DNA-binding protein [Candidatus Riflebacteria bacterium]